LPLRSPFPVRRSFVRQRKCRQLPLVRPTAQALSMTERHRRETNHQSTHPTTNRQ